ncbi:hypothetical protein [Nocardioides soli]|uniref:Uncharacterized protein n=1 Tax=Nocardioides soli TaxID=1036020 RepID=A0A7W4VTB7_9ACTN|nr:hypothetical protein [Nocardioides soli]MBB3041007.1 hypothetical protein [Nocardioides soli]
MSRCLHCGAETTNGLALCELCQRFVHDCLEFLPVYFRNLARWRPGRAGSRQVAGSRVLYDGIDRGAGTGDRISDTLDETLTMLTTRARTLAEDRPHFPRPLTLTDAVLTDDMAAAYADALNDDPARTVVLLCAGVDEHLMSIATTEWCGDMVRELGEHESRLRGLTESAVPGWYAGGCRQPVGFDETGAVIRCETSTYVAPGLTWVTCRGCGATTHVADHLPVILEEAREWVARPRALAEAVVAMVPTEQSVPRLYARIRQWVHRGDLKPRRNLTRGYTWDADAGRIVVADVEIGHARYRLGDVLDRVLTEGATRLGPSADDKTTVAS